MPEAIRPASRLQGFERGMNMIDRTYDRKHRRDIQDEALDMRKENTAFMRDQSVERTDMARERLTLEQERAAAATAATERQVAAIEAQGSRDNERFQWQKQQQDAVAKEAKLKSLSSEAAEWYDLFEREAYGAIDPNKLLDFHNRAVEAGRPTLSPLSWDNETIGRVNKVGPLLEQLRAGNLEHVNAPGNLAILSNLPGWKEKLNVGVGEQGRNGSIITSKELARLQEAPGGRVVPLLTIHTEDGESYEAEMSAFQSTNPDEPVVAADAGKLIDNAFAQYTIANLLNNEEAQATLSAVRNEKFGKNQDVSKLPAQAQLFEYLLAKGYSQGQAEKMAFAARGKSIEDQANMLALSEFEAQDSLSDNNKTLRELRAGWIKDLRVMSETPEPAPVVHESGDAQIASKASGALYDYLKKNPGEAKKEIQNYTERFGEAPEWASEFESAASPATSKPANKAQSSTMDTPYNGGGSLNERLDSAVGKPARAVGGAVNKLVGSVQEKAKAQDARRQYEYFAQRGEYIPTEYIVRAWPYMSPEEQAQYANRVPPETKEQLASI